MLGYYEGKYSEKKRAMVEAYCSGGYTLQQVGAYFGVSYATVSRAVKAWRVVSVVRSDSWILGIDGITLDDYPKWAQAHWQNIKRGLERKRQQIPVS